MLLSLAACGAKEPAAEQPPIAQPAEEQRTASAEEPVTLKFTGWQTENEVVINTMNELFTAQYFNIHVVYGPVTATEYDTNLQTASSTAQQRI